MRRNGRHDQRIALPVVEIFLRVIERLLGRLVVRRRKIQNRFAEHAAHPRFLRHARHHIFEVIHVGIGGNPAA